MFLFLGCGSSPMFWLFYNLHGCVLPAVELHIVITFSTFFMVSGFLWYSLKSAWRFSRFLQYTSRLEMLTCSFNIDFDYYTPTALFLEPLSKVMETFSGKMYFKISFLALLSTTVYNPVLSPGCVAPF